MGAEEVREVQTDRTDLEFVHLACSTMLEAHQIRASADWKSFADMKGRKVAQLVITALGSPEHLERRGAERVPATWWDHFKQRWFPRRALRRWPVRERSITTEYRYQYVCPHRHEDPRGPAHFEFLSKGPGNYYPGWNPCG